MSQPEKERESVTAQKPRGYVLTNSQKALPLREFLANLASLPPDSRAPLLWDDQRERWEAGECPKVEQYARHLPAPVSPDLVLDLIYGEFVLRQEAGEAPSVKEYQKRFPQHAAQISRQLSLHQAFSQSSSTIDERQEFDSIDETPSIPTEIAGYKIVAELPGGGQARVFRAVHPTLGRDVVIKLGRKQESAHRESDALNTEGRILAELDHPGMARIYDLKVYDGRPCLVMEYVRGRHLEQDARDRPRAPLVAAALLARIARALAVAHQRGILHRDIKPRNILIDEEGAPRLIDFGLARFEDAHHSAPDPVGLSGTVSYMAPEQARSEAPTPQSDLFALGGVLYFLLTGQAPFIGATFSEVHAKAKHGDWDRTLLAHKRIPARLRAIVERAMAADPAMRQQSAEELANDLEKLNRPFRTSWLVAACAAAVLAVVAVGGWQVYQLTVPVVSVVRLEAKVAEVKPLANQLQIRVWREDFEKYFDLKVTEPLNTGDKIRIHTKAPGGMYSSLFILSSSGKFQKLGASALANADRVLNFPENPKKTATLEGPDGNEWIIHCARRSGPVNVEDLRNRFKECTGLPTVPHGMAFGLEPGFKVLVPSRDLNVMGGPDRADPEKDLESALNDLDQYLRTICDHHEVILFSHKK